jgi:branched-chain amino acid aminotransferase
MSATVWFNGEFVAECPVDPTDRGLTLGDGLFETMAVFNGKAIWLEDHLARLTASAATLGIATDHRRIEGAVKDVLDKSGEAHGVLRLTLTRGPGVRGLVAHGAKPSLLVTLAPWAKATLFAPVRLVTSSIRRNETSPASRLKTLSYIDNILAAREASAKGGDDALFLNLAGDTASTTIANLFIVKGGRLATPLVEAGVLPGITRKRLLAAARGEQRRIRPAELGEADAVFLTNSLRLMRPVHSLDGMPLRRDDHALAGFFTTLCGEIAQESGIDPRIVDAP